MQETLFEFPPKQRKSRVFKAHVIDAGSAPDGSPIAHFECSRCDWDSGWVDCPTVTYGKRGIPCPICNQTNLHSGGRVHNKHHKTAPPDAVYIGRGSPWGNPFVVGKDGTREEVIERFKREALPKMDLTPLIGKDLVCYCHPKPCHGDTIIELLHRLN